MVFCHPHIKNTKKLVHATLTFGKIEIFAEIWEQFGSEKFLNQMHNVLTIAEIKVPSIIIQHRFFLRSEQWAYSIC